MESNEKPIRHLVVLGHPGEDSFNHAVAETYCAAVHACGQQAVLRDLYAIGFDPRLREAELASRTHLDDEVKAELDLIGDSAVIVLVYPIWFGAPPAIIKGYVDRVLGAGFAADDLRGSVANASMHGKRLMILSSSASTRPWLEEQGQWLGLRQAFDTYLTTIFGFDSADHLHFDSIVPGAQPQYVEECLERTEEAARRLSSALLHERRRARFKRSEPAES